MTGVRIITALGRRRESNTRDLIRVAHLRDASNSGENEGWKRSKSILRLFFNVKWTISRNSRACMSASVVEAEKNRLHRLSLSPGRQIDCRRWLETIIPFSAQRRTVKVQWKTGASSFRNDLLYDLVRLPFWFGMCGTYPRQLLEEKLKKIVNEIFLPC